MLVDKSSGTLPGWRDFERSVALAFNGRASENKDIFDVRLPDPNRIGVNYGISCKMRRELNRIDKDGRVTIELSNSAKRFWSYLADLGIHQGNYKQYPAQVGIGLVNLVHEWHLAVSIQRGGDVDLSRSCYLALSWNHDGWYQIHHFPLQLPDPSTLRWHFPSYKRGGIEVVGNHLNGDDGSGSVFEWYGESGAQLKYYPFADKALWQSDRFRLEPLPEDREHGILSKVKAYFPEKWSEMSSYP